MNKNLDRRRFLGLAAWLAAGGLGEMALASCRQRGLNVSLPEAGSTPGPEMWAEPEPVEAPDFTAEINAVNLGIRPELVSHTQMRSVEPELRFAFEGDKWLADNPVAQEMRPYYLASLPDAAQKAEATRHVPMSYALPRARIRQVVEELEVLEPGRRLEQALFRFGPPRAYMFADEVFTSDWSPHKNLEPYYRMYQRSTGYCMALNIYKDALTAELGHVSMLDKAKFAEINAEYARAFELEAHIRNNIDYKIFKFLAHEVGTPRYDPVMIWNRDGVGVPPEANGGGGCFYFLRDMFEILRLSSGEPARVYDSPWEVDGEGKTRFKLQDKLPLEGGLFTIDNFRYWLENYGSSYGFLDVSGIAYADLLKLLRNQDRYVMGMQIFKETDNVGHSYLLSGIKGVSSGEMSLALSDYGGQGRGSIFQIIDEKSKVWNEYGKGLEGEEVKLYLAKV